MATPDIETHSEPHIFDSGKKLNWLRAAVLGANDGIVSTASLIVGVAGATNTTSFILTAGIAGLVAGALSMGVGEYVSVSTQRDTERALIEKERRELQEVPELEFQELVEIYQRKGLSEATARAAAQELTAHDVFGSHLEAELGIDPEHLAQPGRAAYASALSFAAGAIIPIIFITLPPAAIRIPVTFAGVVLALIMTGTLSAYVGGASKRKATVRVVVGGLLAMAATFGIGKLFGVAGM